MPVAGPEIAATRRDATAGAVGFSRTLRAAGLAVTTDRIQRLVEAMAALDPGRRDDVYWAGRLTVCAGPDDVPRYDAAFAAYFAGATSGQPRRAPLVRPASVPVGVEAPLADPGDPEGDEEVPAVAASASAVEVLRQRDIATLQGAERELLQRLLAVFDLPGEQRRSRRYRPAHRGRIDRARTVRELLHGGGEPARLQYERHRHRPRRVVLLVDVSGSMSAYADALLRFAHAATRRRDVPTEVFTIGTRLTRVTREMAHRDSRTALAAAATAVPDWSGGTRLGVLLKEFLDRWGQRGVARGAIVVVLSDGWERGDAGLLGAQMERLSRLAHRVVWANPRKGHPGYAPLAAGMAAALPYVDDFVEGHSLAALEQLAKVVAARA